MKVSENNRHVINAILAVIISVGLWLYVVNVENPTSSAHLRDLSVQVQGENVLAESDLMVTGLSKEKMNLKVTGKKKTLMKLSKKNVSLTVDVSAVTGEGNWTLTCKADFPSNVSTDSIAISDWNDLKVTVTVARQETKKIPVRGQFIGTESESCLAGEVETAPSQLELKGPAETLSGISYALAQVGGEDVKDTLVQQVTVVLMGENDKPANVENVTCSQSTVSVTVPIQQVVSVPLTVQFKDGGGATGADIVYTIQPETVTLVAGDKELPASISLGEIDLNQMLGATSYSLPIHLPQGVTGWNMPKVASVSVSLGTLATRQIAVEDISLQNVPQGYTASLVSHALYVWVRGDADKVADITADQISVEVDLSQAVPGELLQRFPAKVALQGDGLDGVGIIGTQYSVALRLKQ